MIYRISVLIGVILLPISAVLATGIPEASAATVTEYCVLNTNGGTLCLNAWNGGPYVKVETSNNPVIQNNNFQVRYEANGDVELQFVGGGAWNGQCIGDASNEYGLADTSLDPCGSPSNGNGSGWGTQLQMQQWPSDGPCFSDQVAFFDWRWHGYLGPTGPGAANGTPWYLNKPQSNPICFNIEGN
jgi:hypothetical protein